MDLLSFLCFPEGAGGGRLLVSSASHCATPYLRDILAPRPLSTSKKHLSCRPLHGHGIREITFSYSK